MKVLFLTPYLPTPPRSGGPRRLHGLISGLAQLHAVSVLSLVQTGEDITASLAATETYCDEVVTVPNERYGPTNASKRKLQLKSMVTPNSYERLVYHRPALQVALDRMVQRTHYDIINVEFSQMAYYRFPSTSTLVLDEHNIEYDILHRTFTAETGLLRKAYSYVDYRKLRREEQTAWHKVDGISLTSTRDEQLLRSVLPDAQTAVVPNGVDTAFFRPLGTTSEPMTILFFGAVNYYPNTQGLLFFLQDVLPHIKRRYPLVKFTIVGQSPPEAIYRWASEDVIITGVVEDIRPYLERASVIVAPLLIGGGTRLKILEAMSMGKAVVSTPVGAEGINVTNEQDILIASTAEEFATQVGRLLDDQILAARIGTAAHQLVKEQYEWRVSVRKLDRFYQQLLVPDSEAHEKSRTQTGATHDT